MKTADIVFEEDSHYVTFPVLRYSLKKKKEEESSLSLRIARILFARIL